MRIDELLKEEQLDEFLPALASGIAKGAQVAGNAAVQGAKTVGQGVANLAQKGVQTVAQGIKNVAQQGGQAIGGQPQKGPQGTAQSATPDAPPANQPQTLQKTDQGTGTIQSQPPVDVQNTPQSANKGNDANAQAAGQPADPSQAPPGSPQAQQQQQQDQQASHQEIDDIKKALAGLEKRLGPST